MTYQVVCVLVIFAMAQCGETTESKPNLRTLRVTQVLFRHGSRSIDNTYPNDPYKDEKYWAPGYFQLNNQGKLQAFELGVYLRERYEGFIQDTYDLKELYALSSDYPRTIQSAYSVLAGFYLPNGRKLEENQTVLDAIERNEIEVSLPWKSVPVHTIPQEYDNIIRQREDICPRYYELLKESSDTFEGKEEREQVFKIFSDHGGIPVTNYLQFAKLYDALVVETQRNMTLPSWTDSIYKTELGQGIFTSFFHVLCATEEMKRLRVGPMLKRMVENMKKNESHYADEFLESATGQKKMYMFSGHDATVFGLMYTLGINNGIRAKYSTAIMLELHQNETNPEDMYLEIYYKNETDRDPYKLVIPNCGHPCPLNTFLDLIHPYIPLDWNAECQLLQGSTTISAAWIVVIILVVWVVFFLVLQCWLHSSRGCWNLGKENKRRKSYAEL